MRVTWHFARADIDAVRAEAKKFRRHPIVRDRYARNLKAPKPEVTRERFWRALAMALLTTQQPSGPKTAVRRLLATRPFQLAHPRLLAAEDPRILSSTTLVAFGGIRRHGVISAELAENLSLLESGEWPTVLEALHRLSKPVEPPQERQVADYLADRFAGLGPKQSRNLLQALGLTRFEVPVDRRVAKWLRTKGFPVPISAAALSDRDYYCFVLDGVQALCKAAEVYPCVLDGAVFASYDTESWTDDLLVY